MSEDSNSRGGAGRSSRPDRDASASRPTTAAGRRRAAARDDEADPDSGALATGTRTLGKGAPTPSRDGRSAPARVSPLARLVRFIREVVAELRKVHWPSRRQVMTYTIVVLVFVAFMVSLVSLLDWAFGRAVLALFG